MKLLFVHNSEKLKEDIEGNLYTDGSYNMEIWERYLSISNKVTAVFRRDKNIYNVKYAQKKFNRVKEGINFIEVINRTASIKSYLNFKEIEKNKNIIKEAVKNNDYLIVRSPTGVGYTAIKYAKKFRKPYLIEMVGCPWDSLWHHSLAGKIMAPNSYLRSKYSVLNAPYVLYVTNEFLQRRYKCKGKTINCSDVVLPYIDTNTLGKRLNKINNKDNKKSVVLGTIASVNVRYKGQEYVIKAISKLNKQGYNFEYHLVGGGDIHYLKSVAKKYGVINKVMFLGAIPHSEIFDYLDNIDIYIQPSKTEGLPRALIEAMSRACPSIGSNVGGIPELLDDEFIFQYKSVDQICNIIKAFDKNTMKEEANRNFLKSKDYSKEILESKRALFLKDFLKYCKQYTTDMYDRSF